MAAVRWHVRFYGGLLLRGPDRTITHFRSQKTATLLAYIAYHRGRTFPREVLASMLWPGPAAAGRHSLSTALSSLRHQLELPGLPASLVLVLDPCCVTFSTETTTTDVCEFKAALLRAERASSADERIRALKQAVEFYRGEFLPGFYDDWVLEEQLSHSERFVKALCDLTVLLEKRGENVAALDYARRATQADPLREEPYQELMRLYAAMGEPSAALRYYRELVRVFRQELGEVPSAASRALAKNIEAGLVLTGASAPAKADATRPGPGRAPRARPVAAPPAGTVTFLLMNASSDSRSTSQSARFEQVFRREIQSHGGYAGATRDQPLLGVFARAVDGTSCAVACQTIFAAKVRTAAAVASLPRAAIHTGDAEPHGDTYDGPVVDHATGLLAAAHAGQILCSEATARLLRPLLVGGGAVAHSLGVYRIGSGADPERLHQVEHPGMARRAFPPPLAARGHPSNLPLHLPRFFGREEEIKFLTGLLTADDCRLVTVAGPPGIGKSRLALEAAARLLEPFGGTVWYAPLAGLRDAARIPEQILAALAAQLEQGSPPSDQLIRVLADERGLLVLDDMEPLPDAASLVRNLLADCRGLKILVTSREKLRLPGERELTVGPLPVQGAADTATALTQVPSVQIFVDRARAIQPDFALTEENAPALADICKRLGGFPLAIELAASCMHKVGIRDAIDHFASALDLGDHDGPGAETRHWTLRTALDWSHNRLPPGVQRFFAQLAVFRDGWTAEAAERVCCEPLALDYLADLTDCSLILAEPGPRVVRFRMLELIHEYAWEHLRENGGEATALDRHLDYHLDLAERAAAEFQTRARAEWSESLASEQENLLAAIEHGRRSPRGIPLALRLAVALHRFWWHRGQLDLGRTVLTDLLEEVAAPQRSQLRAEALVATGLLAREQGDHHTAQRYLQDGLLLQQEHGDARGAAAALHELGILHARLGDFAAARVRYAQALSLACEAGDRRREALVRGDLGATYLGAGQWEEAQEQIEPALATLRALDDQPSVAAQLANLAVAVRGAGQAARADGILRECMAICRELGDQSGIARALAERARARIRAGDCPTAGRQGESATARAAAAARATSFEQAIAQAPAAIGEPEPSAAGIA